MTGAAVQGIESRTGRNSSRLTGIRIFFLPAGRRRIMKSSIFCEEMRDKKG